jgi:hypothetical protein
MKKWKSFKNRKLFLAPYINAAYDRVSTRRGTICPSVLTKGLTYNYWSYWVFRISPNANAPKVLPVTNVG